MGSALSAAAGPVQPTSSYLTLVPSHTLDKNLRTTRFLKTIRTKYKSTLKVVKVFVKTDPSMELSKFKDEIERVRKGLDGNPNAQSFQSAVENERCGILARPYFKSNLYDRVSTRPLLDLDEKRWITFQLLKGLALSHKNNVCHGDIKIDNVMLTSWNWVVLCDYASFKPSQIPEDNPAGFSYFFDISGRRTCCVAPERFYVPDDSKQEGLDSDVCRFRDDLTPAMDIFSLGCVIFELMTDGAHLFDLSMLLNYRAGKLDPRPILQQIDDVEIRQMVTHMISLEPANRDTAHAYLEKLKGHVFPHSFGNVLHPYLSRYATGETLSPDQKIMKLKQDLDVLETAFSKENDKSALDAKTNCYVILGSLVTACWRSLRVTRTKLIGLKILRRLSAKVPDAYKLDRFLPFMVYSLSDRQTLVRVSAIRTLTSMVQTVKSVRASDLNLFPGYIFPNIVDMNKKDSEVFVRVAYAENVAILAKTAQRFLEVAQLASIPDNADETEVSRTESMSYDGELDTLHTFMQEELVTIMKESIVKQTLLHSNITTLCTFFGPAKIDQALLCHMFTFFNEKKDWPLRLAFFKSIVPIAAYCGSMTEILPFIERSLTDSEEFVIEQTLKAITTFVELRLVPKEYFLKLLSTLAPLLVHPSIWIRYATVALVSSVARTLSLLDVHCTLRPIVEKYLTQPVLDLADEMILVDALKGEIPRKVYEAVVRSPEIDQIYDALLHKRMNEKSGVTKREFKSRHESSIRQLQDLGMSADVESALLDMEDLIKKIARERIRLAEDAGAPDANMKSPKIWLENLGIPINEVALPDSIAASEATDVNGSPRQMRSLPSPNPPNKSQPKQKSSLDLHNANPSFSFPRSEMSSSKKSNTPFDEYKISVQKQFGRRRQFAHRGNMNNSIVTPAALAKGKKAKLAAEARDQEANALRSWRPQGRMVGHLTEHKANINQLELLPNQRYFLTASDDMTVCLWDCAQLEGRDVANRSRLQYKAQKAKIKHVAVCDNSRMIGSSGDDGSLHLFSVDSAQTVRERMIDVNTYGRVVDLKPLNVNSPVLAYATVSGHVAGWDTRTANDGWSFKSCPHHGLIQSILIDRTQSCLTTGCTRGVYSLWDLRFQLPIKSWLHANEARVQHLAHFPLVAANISRSSSSDTSSWIISAAGPNQASLWDMKLSKIICNFRAAPVLDDSEIFSGRKSSRQIVSLDGQPIKRPSSIVPPRSAFEFYKLKLQRQWRHHNDAALAQKGQEERWNSMNPQEKLPYKSREVEDALRYQDELTECLSKPWAGTPRDTPESLPFSAICTHPSNSAVFLGAADGRIRIWDLDKPRESFILGDSRPVPGASIRPGAETTYEVSKGSREVVEALGSESRSRSVVGLKSEHWSRAGHSGMVTGLALITAPEKLLISSSRDGVVKIWK
eukprot:m.31247 g.31247  ORF g.31247 m.31247 type:complete len:1414 (+) comp8296_c0_seq1:129-4370(+)